MQKHADILDDASAITEEFTQRSVENILRQGGQPVLPFKGTCYNCLDSVEAPRRFCDEECAREFSYIQERAKANRIVK